MFARKQLFLFPALNEFVQLCFRKEVNLVHNLKTPFIPLLLEKRTPTGTVQWPLEGTVGVILCDKIYIDCCKPDSSVQQQWTCPAFEQLERKLKEIVRVRQNVSII